MRSNCGVNIFLLISAVLLFTSCQHTPKGVTQALKLAEKNKDQLQKVIDHYKKEGDKQKLEAAYYLIENMHGKGWAEYKPYAADGREAPYYLFDYTNSDTIHRRKKEVEDSMQSPILYNVSRIVEDIKTVTADFLIENIDYAFKAWQLPWAKHLNFEQFCEYLLPYRFGTEPLQPWRKNVFEKMQWLLDSLITGSNDLIRACSIVNDSLKRAFAYRHYELDFYPFVLNYQEVLKLKGGRCDDLNLVAAYWMRAIGIPVVNDFTPVWANSNFGGHTWLALLANNGQHIPFNAAYDNPIPDSLPFKDKLCKIYRRQYKAQPNTFRYQFPNEEEYPGYLFTNNYYDVTQEYLKTANVEVPITFNKSYNKEFAYIGVLCEKNWQIVDVGKVKQGKVQFQKAGPSTIYTAFYFNMDTVQILSSPFWINDKSEVEYFQPDTKKTDSVCVNIRRDYWWLRKDRTYQLTYWENTGWVNVKPPLKWDGQRWRFSNISDKAFTDSTVTYGSLPEKAVFRFQNTEPIFDIGSFGRPFLIQNNTYQHF